MDKEIKICSRCVLDTTVPSIRFDEDGVCNYCKSHNLMLEYYPQDEETQKVNLNTIIKQIKRKGKSIKK